ncbi:hypothetical protein PUN28_017619 [Cardiocondyla obscurior]|uniref:Uncharacterized protein n=1 Tax=Cardiocondyla obscurior TaxID=286306 RepID=A0AAW2EJG5_9HYME
MLRIRNEQITYFYKIFPDCFARTNYFVIKIKHPLGAPRVQDIVPFEVTSPLNRRRSVVDVAEDILSGRTAIVLVANLTSKDRARAHHFSTTSSSRRSSSSCRSRIVRGISTCVAASGNSRREAILATFFFRCEQSPPEVSFIYHAAER